MQKEKLNFVRTVKSVKLRWTGYVGRTVYTRNTHGKFAEIYLENLIRCSTIILRLMLDIQALRMGLE
jgi:hypothetical protein